MLNLKILSMNKKYEKANKRKRCGYDDVVGDVLLVKKGTVSSFVTGLLTTKSSASDMDSPGLTK